MLMDLSNAYELEAYGFDKTSLHLLRHYLSNRKQRTKVDSGFSD